MKPRTQYCKTSDGISIAYGTIGDGPPLVVACAVWGDLNMSAGYEGWWRPHHDLAHKVVVYDGRGMGASDRDAAEYTIDARLTNLEAVVDELKLDRFPVYGHAAGVSLAIAYAAKHPERVARLVLVNGAASGRDWYRSVPSMRVASGLTNMAVDEWESFTMALAGAVVDYRDMDTVDALAAAFRDGMSAEEYLLFVRQFGETDVRDLLPRLQAQTLLLHVSDYIKGTLPLMREMASQIPGALLEETTAGEAASLIRDFLGVGGQSATSVVTQREGGASVATVLFTDVVGHTAMMSRLGDERGRDVLRDHERITRKVLAANGGKEVKTMGDGFMASFVSVTKAVDCAIALQRAFAEREGEPLSVRVGLNAGEPIEEDGDLFGATVILASRIAAKADGGQILVADTVRGLCSGKGFLFSDRGEFVAKGFEDPVRVYEVSWREV